MPLFPFYLYFHSHPNVKAQHYLYRRCCSNVKRMWNEWTQLKYPYRFEIRIIEERNLAAINYPFNELYLIPFSKILNAFD